jgi:hypothetical protein
LEKSSPKIRPTFLIFKKQLNLNNHPMGESGRPASAEIEAIKTGAHLGKQLLGS